MKTSCILAGLVLTTLAQPILADSTVVTMKPPLMIFRDSDGIVISVIHPIDYYSPFPGDVSGGHVIYTMGGVPLEFSAGPGVTMDNAAGGGPIAAGGLGPMAAGGVGPTAVVGGTIYKVEVSGNDIWLRDPVTGTRYATERRLAAVQGGLQVNPNGFAME